MTKFKVLSAGLIAAAMLTTPLMAREYRHVARGTMSAPRVASLMGVTASALRTSAHMRRTPTPDPRANPRRIIDQSAPHRAERPGNEPGSITVCPLAL